MTETIKYPERLLIFYGREKVKEVMTTLLHLDEDILYLASAILETPLMNFYVILPRSTGRYFKNT